MFVSSASEINNLINEINPVAYGKTRNYVDGAVTKLSPYISRGCLSTKRIAQHVLAKGYEPGEIESFLKELAWRDYFQEVWKAKGIAIEKDLKNPQTEEAKKGIPLNLINASCGITAIDRGIESLYETGYLHNHLRLYVASIACNIARCAWMEPAQWMYYHLLDADWASNVLSWQWVAGTFSNKKYYANQQNINKYCKSNQRNTFLDLEYEDLPGLKIPKVLETIVNQKLRTNLPETEPLKLNPNLPIYVYNFYNLDYTWDQHLPANRILLFEPGHFAQYPISEKSLNFALSLAKNIINIQIVVDEFENAFHGIPDSVIHYKEHPFSAHYRGNEHARERMFPEISGYYPSFFAFWKKAEKQLGALKSGI